MKLSEVLYNSLYQDFSISPPNRIILDEDYSLLSEKDVFETFPSIFKDYLQTNQLSEYSQEENDCDDFAFHAFECMRIKHYRQNPKRETGVMFGVFMYYPDIQENLEEPVGHSINFFLIKGIGEYEFHLHFFEPQNQTRLILSEKEIKSCISYIF